MQANPYSLTAEIFGTGLASEPYNSFTMRDFCFNSNQKEPYWLLSEKWKFTDLFDTAAIFESMKTVSIYTTHKYRVQNSSL